MGFLEARDALQLQDRSAGYTWLSCRWVYALFRGIAALNLPPLRVVMSGQTLGGERMRTRGALATVQYDRVLLSTLLCRPQVRATTVSGDAVRPASLRMNAIGESCWGAADTAEACL